MAETDVVLRKCFDEQLLPKLREFDLRHGAQFGWALGLLLLGVVVLLPGLVAKSGFFLVSGIGLAAAGGIWLGSLWSGKRRRFKAEVVPEILAALYPEIGYFPDDGIARGRFADTRLFGSFDRYRSEDRLAGTRGKTRLELAEVRAERKVRSNKNTHYETVFHGVLLIADFNKNFRGRTVVLPDVAERFLGSLVGKFLQNCNFTEGQAVRLEDPAFEKLFSVYSSDQIEARYLLTPDMMARLTRLRQRTGGGLRVLFENSRLVIAAPTAGNWLEPPFFGKLADFAVVEEVRRELAFALDIIDELDLNTRIWNKA